MGRVRRLGAGLVATLALVACSGGGGAPAADPATSTNTEAAGGSASGPIGTSPGTPTSPLPTTTRSGVTPAVTTPPPVAVGTFVNGREEPVLGEPTGWHFWIVSRHQIFVVDLDTGAIRQAPAPDFFGQLYAVHGGLFFENSGRDDPLVAVDAERPDAPVRITGATFVDFRATDQAHVWARTANGYGEFAIDGTLVREVSGVRWPSGTIGNQFVVARGGRIFLVDVATGASREWAVGTLTNVSRGRIVWRECDEHLTCRSWVGTESDPRARAIEPTTSLCGIWYEGYHSFCDGSFSADGRFYLAWDQTPDAGRVQEPTLFELDSQWKDVVRWPTPRDHQNTGDFDGLMLSPDGRWMFGLRADTGRVTALEVATGRVVEFDVVPPQGGGLHGSFAVG